MAKKLFLLDGMALAYRAHFAFMQRPIRTSQGVNTSALFGFVLTLLDLIDREKPTHLAVAFDTSAPTQRHIEFPDYKAQREAMPEDLVVAIPNIYRLCELMRIPALKLDGYEADDIIGTLVRRAEKEGFNSYMVTPDKDFSQLVNETTLLYKPSRSGDGIEIHGPAEISAKWGVPMPEQVIDILALWGDASDNIPGVPGIGEKTAAKLIAQYGSVENLLAHTAELKGKLKENLETHAEQARLCRRLATINVSVPLDVTLDQLVRQDPDSEGLRSFCSEFEFSTLGRRLVGADFKIGQRSTAGPTAPSEAPSRKASRASSEGELLLFPGATESPESTTTASAAPDNKPEGTEDPAPAEDNSPTPITALRTVADTPHRYQVAATPEERRQLIAELGQLTSFCFDTETTSLDTKTARLVGLSFSWNAQSGWYVPVPQDPAQASEILAEFRGVLENSAIEKIGHNLKYDLSVLSWLGVNVQGPIFDTMIAHALVEPEMRHGMDYLSQIYLGYSPVPISKLIGEKDPICMSQVPLDQIAEYAAEDADITWQLRHVLEPKLKERGQEKVFYEIEMPLVRVLIGMEKEGIRIDSNALDQFAKQLTHDIGTLQQTIQNLAGIDFNLNSPKQLGEVLFERLKIVDKPKKTKTGQYATNEQVLSDLAPRHEIVRRILEHRTATKLKSTYADTLPSTIFQPTGRVHTTYQQILAVTGRLSSHDPNLQNIPIRTDLGQEIRRAFVARDADHLLLSADYSQIELRIIAALSQDPGMLEAFQSGLDIHTATAAKVYGVMPQLVSDEMRRNAKMVNFGIAYGISAFGLAQRLGIPRAEAAGLIDNYFRQYSRTQGYIQDTIAFAQQHGYVQTVTGRRRYLPDIHSTNATTRGAAERNAINMPIQGTAADMIKIAMIRIDAAIRERGLRTRMILQIHDELVFDLYRPEEAEVRALVESEMRNALPLAVPIAVEMGVGENWLEAH
jgi:DNA polymerase-1